MRPTKHVHDVRMSIKFHGLQMHPALEKWLIIAEEDPERVSAVSIDKLGTRATYSEMFLGIALLVVAPLELSSFTLLNLP